MKHAISRRNGDEILSEFREHAQKCPNSSKIPEILQNFEKKSVKFQGFIEKFNREIHEFNPVLIPQLSRPVG